MVILLDLDGVLITTPAWRPVELAPDGFFVFNAQATENLAHLLAETNAAIVLTTSHRINYALGDWWRFFHARGLHPAALTKVNDRTTLRPSGSRADDLAAWVARPDTTENYVVLDDDLSLHGLPPAIKARCVLTRPLIGLDETASRQALNILRGNFA